MTPEALSDLIAGIYDRALDPEGWPTTLGRIARGVDAPFGMMAIHDLVANRGIRTFAHGLPAPVLWLYGLRYAARNPIATAASALVEEGRVDTVRTLIGDEAWQRSALYRELIRPAGARDVLGMAVVRQENRGTWLGAIRRKRDGDFTSDHVRLFRLLAPHVVRSMRFADLLGLRAIEVDRLSAAIDALSAAVWLVDGAGRVLHANVAAEALLRRDGPLRMIQGRLTARNPAEDAALRRALAESTAGDFGAAATPQATLALGDGSAGVGLALTLLPLPQGVPQGATVAVFVQQPAAAPATPVDAFAALHGLTPAEARCLAEILLGRTVPEAARALGVGEATARSHLKRIFEKTGASRQSELVRLAAGYAAPLRSVPRDVPRM
jgi:DNA-binding CsgD family transcriptional regulator/PAS domain-containing protein